MVEPLFELYPLVLTPGIFFNCILSFKCLESFKIIYFFLLHYGGNIIYSLGLGKDFLFSVGLMVCVCACFCLLYVLLGMDTPCCSATSEVANGKIKLFEFEYL